MTKLFLTIIGIWLFASPVYSQCKCDTVEVYKIVDAIASTYRLNSHDKNAKYWRLLTDNSSNRNHLTAADAIFAYNDCGKLIWKQSNIKSTVFTVTPDSLTHYMDIVTHFDTPIFNKSRRQCKVYVGSHESEWGGSGRLYFFRKRFGKWHFTKSYLQSIS